MTPAIITAAICGAETTREMTPYLPTTRRFINPLYLRLELIPDRGHLLVWQEAERLAPIVREFLRS